MATLQHRSAFNLRGSQPIGGSALEPTDSSCDGQVLDNIYEQVRQAAKDYKWESERTTLRAKLTYSCPKVGDAVRWDPSISGFNLAYAMFDTNNPADQEHLTEVVGIVESVTVDCSGDGVDFTDDSTDTNAVIVLSGKISFDTLPTESNLSSGKVYYLWDRGTPSHLALANNIVNDMREPTISKPLFIATGTNTAIVVNYRPLTGSPTGGKPKTEQYEITVTPIADGWNVRINNTGGVSSRHPLVAQLDYNRLTGPLANLNGNETYTMFKHVGILHDQFSAKVTDDDSLEHDISFDVTIDSEFGIKGGVANNSVNGINGVGSLTVSLKSNTTGSMSASMLKSLIPFQTNNPVNRIPSIAVNAHCEFSNDIGEPTQNNPDIPDHKVTVDGVSGEKIHEGVIFELSLQKTTSSDLFVYMSEDLWFKIESPALPQPIYNKFQLTKTQTAVEIIPVNDKGQGITRDNVKISIVNSDQTELHINHWANSVGTKEHMCDTQICCNPTEKITLNTSANVDDKNIDAPLSDLFDNDDSEFMNNPDNAAFYSLDPDKEPALPAFADLDTLKVTYKNAREDTILCYPMVKHGTRPAFMTLYFNEAKPASELSRDSKSYDPRYTAIEIGAQDTLQDKIVTLTLLAGQSTSGGTTREVCIDFEFDGSEVGTHYTFNELLKFGKITRRSTNASADVLFKTSDV